MTESDLQNHETKWQAYFDQLPAYRLPDGTLYVSKDGLGGNSKLWLWCTQQRREHSRGKLTPERTARLEEVGFSWRPNRQRKGGSSEATWELFFRELLDLKARHPDWREGCDLSAARSLWVVWAKSQTSKRERGILRADRLARLEAEGFPWQADYRRGRWEAHYAELVQFKDQHGHANVTATLPGPYKLSTWCQRQRALKARGHLPLRHLSLLEAIGFPWE